MIIIIGAGPAGCYLGYLLAKKGKEVKIIEEHNRIGIPVQCTGIVTSSIENFFKLPNKVIANKCSKVVVVSKNKKIYANTKEIVMWRNKFDEFLGDMAINEGAKILLNSQFLSIEKNKIKIRDKQSNKLRELKYDFLIGADGPSSYIAKCAGLNPHNKYYIGMQAKVHLATNMDSFETHFGDDYPNFFGWVVPESEDTARIGLGSMENAKNLFYQFLERRTGSKKILCWESGIIPLYNPKQLIQKGNLFLIGDAATQVKATTGGGIIPSLKSAETLADCIINNKNYNLAYKFQSGKELLLHLKLRNVLNKFTNSDYDYLLSLMEQVKVKKILNKYDRDTPIPLMLNLLVKEPRFLSFGKYLF